MPTNVVINSLKCTTSIATLVHITCTAMKKVEYTVEPSKHVDVDVLVLVDVLVAVLVPVIVIVVGVVAVTVAAIGSVGVIADVIGVVVATVVVPVAGAGAGAGDVSTVVGNAGGHLVDKDHEDGAAGSALLVYVQYPAAVATAD